MQIIFDDSHFSGTDLDRDIVAYASMHYMYRYDMPEWDDSEAWQFIADDAMDWMNTVEEENGQYYMIDDNSLYLAKYGEE
jgi:hypothetical protein